MTAAGTALWRRSSWVMVGFGAFRAQHVSCRYMDERGMQVRGYERRGVEGRATSWAILHPANM